MEHCSVLVYTSLSQTEQPFVIRHATAISLAGGLLTIESEHSEAGISFSSFHRYQPGKWAHFEVFNK